MSVLRRIQPDSDLESEGLRLRIYVNKRRQLSVEFEYEDKRGGQFDTRVMLKESPLKEELKKDIYRAIDNVLEKYKDIVDTPIFDDLINRKEQDIRKMSDYDDEFTELFGGIGF